MMGDQLAALLDGREYGNEITEQEKREAKAAGLVAAFGYSDDNVELVGAIDDEIGAWNGTTIHLTTSGLLTNECDNDKCPHFEQSKKAAAKLKAIWNDGCDGPAWTFEALFPHETFMILEDGQPFCRGIVFHLCDVDKVENSATT